APEYIIPCDGVLGRVTQPLRYSSDGRKMITAIGETAVVFDMDQKQTAPRYTYSVTEVRHTRNRTGLEVNPERIVGLGFDDRGVGVATIYGRVDRKHVLGLFDVEKKSQRAHGVWLAQDSNPNFNKGTVSIPDVPLKAAIPTPDGRGMIVI